MTMAENRGLARDVGRRGQESQAWALQDGSRIAVIGAGPAGSGLGEYGRAAWY